jgi:hypothetical protein
VDIVNKNPKKKISEYLNTLPPSLNSMLLDPITGDLYDYNYTAKKWQPKVNSGLHYKQMNEMDPIYRKMNPPPVYTVTPVEEDYPLIKGVNIEAIIRPDDVITTKQNFRGHYLIHNLASTFLGINPTGWLTHPVAFLNPDKKFDILAKDESGTSQILTKGCTTAVLFPILKKYKESLKILDNYLQHMIKAVMNSSERDRKSIFVE